MTMAMNRWQALAPYQPLKPADRPHRLTLKVQEVVDGEALTACPHCHSALVIDVPAWKATLDGVAEVALPDALLFRLTRTEGRLFAVLHAAKGQWVHNSMLLARAWGPEYSDAPYRDGHIVRVNVCRIRPKLEGTGWRIDNAPGKGLYRLVEVQGDA